MINPRFISILKNIKGVVYVAPEDNPLEGLKWLSRRFRYRFIGKPPSIHVLPEVNSIFSKKPFIELYYPSKAIEEIVELISRQSEIDKVIVEALALASAYVTPLITFPKSAKRLEQLATLKVLSNRKIPEAEIKRHLRIAGYTILDFHEKTTTEAYSAILKACEEANLKEKFIELLSNRKKLANRDAKRYWRVVSNEGDPMLLYLDLIKCLKDVSEKELLKIMHDESVSLIFGIIPCFILRINSSK